MKLWKLRILKKLINFPVFFLDRLIRFPDPQFFQTKMLVHIYSRLRHVYRIDCKQGTFGPEPDGNFIRLLSVSAKLLAGMSDSDPYYRKWLGLALILASREIHEFTPPPTFLKEQIEKQWFVKDITGLPDGIVAVHAKDFKEWAISDYLPNLVDMESR